MNNLDNAESALLAVQRCIDKASMLYGRGIKEDALAEILKDHIRSDALIQQIIATAKVEFEERNK